MAKVSVLKCNSYDEDKVYSAIKKALEDIGYKLKPNLKVLLKPNVLSGRAPEKAITTHPNIISAICRILHENGIKDITIGDSSGLGHYGMTSSALEASCIKKAGEKYNAKVVSFEGHSIVAENEKNIVLKKYNAAKAVKEAELVINVPKLKTHMFMKYTGAVKNMFGVIPGGGKAKCHTIAPTQEKFGDLLLDIYQDFKPGLNIMDAVIGLEGNGPGSGGVPKQTGLILVSEDAVALDFVASKIIGFEPMEIATNSNAIKRGIFDGNFEVIGEKNVSVPYKKPISAPNKLREFASQHFFRFTIVQPVVNEEKCKACGICVKACPVHTIKMKDKAFIYKDKCIRCYCCHELCPYNAIELKTPLLMRIFKKIRG